ncbi:Kinesin-like protein KIF21B [Strongyloides ratti]|uniref:Kinesin-like protein KIF21B n=1 Tax=Strongyloides ratti TaxID=34506 RepID=A0A090N121_STRRB|nr:Kinesin-like protein KIF21B [Strongyloides ratti]CEF71678.1 Kinesin-like protein KIF21B [Strongyloides ratti]
MSGLTNTSLVAAFEKHKFLYPTIIISLFGIEGALLLSGSGKTFTMGTSNGHLKNLDDETLGLIPQSIISIFNEIKNRKNEAKEKELSVSSFQVSVSFLELYNDEINDLLLSDKSSSSNEKLKITRNKEGKIEVNGPLKKNVEDAPTAFKIFNSGINKRCVGATDLNVESSRSHIIFSLYLTQINEKMGLKDGVTEVLTSKFNFVDLAGTERLKRTNAEGNTAKEGKNINNCLLHLENVISALSCKDQHIPYRNSKLTHLLQDSLGGNSKTLMIACISPSNEDLCETISTLNYASRA